MASSVEKELAKHLECGICLERFEEPKMLTCQHSYCKKCLERLVTRDEITCPECRSKTEVPSGDVKGLPSNFLINKLLSIRGNDQSNVSKPCEKHDGEILKLFCQDCDQLICRDCIIFDHRDHKYAFLKDIFPAVKKEILEVLQKSRANIIALESNILTIKEQEDNMHKNSMEVDRELDSFIDMQLELLERKRRSVKDNLQKSVATQKKILDAQKECFQTSLGFMKSSVEVTEEALSKGSEVEILSAKNQMVKQLTELNSATSELKPRGRIYYILELPETQINLAALTTQIREYDEEYELLIRSREGWKTLSKDVRSKLLASTDFCVRPKSKSSTVDQASEVQVTIAKPGFFVDIPEQVPVTNEPDGSYNFSKEPETSGLHTIKVLINGRYVYGSPFTWRVQRMVEKK